MVREGHDCIRGKMGLMSVCLGGVGPWRNLQTGVTRRAHSGSGGGEGGVGDRMAADGKGAPGTGRIDEEL